METKRLTSKEIISYIAEKFPACFSLEGQAKPLKIGIFQDLAERLADDEVVSKTRLRQALRHYTSSWRYLKCVKEGAFRVDLDGKDVAAIDKEQADYASQTLKQSQEKFANNNKKDTAEKKPYKGKNTEQVVTSKPKPKPKAKPVQKRAEKKPSVKLNSVTVDNLSAGMKVKVRIGQAPMDAVITEVVGKDVSVQLTSGMVVKTQVQHIFTE